MEWLKKTIIGFTRTSVDISQISKVLQTNHCRFENLLAWNKHKFIIVCESVECKKDILKLGLKQWGPNVRQIREWKESDTARTGEGIWFSCLGVPLHCWSEHTFEKIGYAWGQVLEVDLGHDFDRACLLLDMRYDALEDGKAMETILICNGIEYPITLLKETREFHTSAMGSDAQLPEQNQEKGAMLETAIHPEKGSGTPPAEKETNSPNATVGYEKPRGKQARKPTAAHVHGPRKMNSSPHKEAREKSVSTLSWRRVDSPLQSTWEDFNTNGYVMMESELGPNNDSPLYGPKKIKEGVNLELEWAICNDISSIETLLRKWTKKSCNVKSQRKGKYTLLSGSLLATEEEQTLEGKNDSFNSSREFGSHSQFLDDNPVLGNGRLETQLKDFTQTVVPKVVIVELSDFCEDEQILFPKEIDGLMEQARWRKSVIDQGMEEKISSMEENRQGLSSRETKMG